MSLEPQTISPLVISGITHLTFLTALVTVLQYSASVQYWWWVGAIFKNTKYSNWKIDLDCDYFDIQK